MRTKQRKLGLTLLSLVMAIALVLGVTSFASTVKAEDPVTTVTMQNGARLRVEEDAPALVYTATIENFDSALEYGMLLVEANNLVGVSDYVAELDAQTYQKVECAPYGTETKKITAYFDIAADKLITQYAGIAYIYNGETYVYTEVTNNNIRSVDYVAQMAYLKGDGDKDVLATFISCEISEDLYGVNAEQTANNEAIVDGTNTYLSIVVDNLNEAIDFYDGSTELSFRSSQPYAGGSIVKFDIYVPAEVNGRYWVQFGTTTSKNVVDFYANPDITEKTAAGAWLTATCQLPEGEDTYYFYITANKGGWNDGADVHYELRLDNFVVTEPSGATFTQDFENGYNGGDDETTVNFTVRGNEAKGIKVEDVVRCETFGGSITLGGAAPELAMKYVFNVGLDNSISFVSKEAFAGGSELSFYYFIPAGTPTSWWRVSYDTTQEIDFYHSPYLNLGATTGAWTLATVTLPAGDSYYVTITSEVSATNWKIEGENSHVLIDNFAVNGEVVENFNHGVARSIFEVRKPVAVMDSADGEGLVIEDSGDESSEHAAKLNYKAWSGTEIGIIEFVTKEAYPSGTVITFKYKTVNAPNGCWNYLATCTDPEKASVYAEASGQTNTSKWVHSLADTQGTWIEVTYTLTETAYVHFAANVGSAWADGYMLVDDFSVTVGGNTVTDNFNDGLNKGLFNVNGSGVVEFGDGYFVQEEPEFTVGEHALKIYHRDNGGKVPGFFNQAVPGGSVVSFKYYIPEGTELTAGAWWRTSYTTDVPNEAAWTDYYDASHFANTLVIGDWITVTVTLPTDAESYYVFFVTEEGNKWKAPDGSPAYILVDDFTVTSGEEVVLYENFNEGLTAGTYVIRDEATYDLAMNEGYEPPKAGEKSAKLVIDIMSSSKANGFITTQAYTLTEATVVTFDYLMVDNDKPAWWCLFWTDDKNVASVYAHVENNKDHNDGRDLPKDVHGTWATASITVPAGTWHFYISGEVGQWGDPNRVNGKGYVLIDNFKVGNVVSEDFNNATGFGIFEDNRDSYPNAITLVDDPRSLEPAPEPEVPEEPEVTFESLIEAGTVLDYVLDTDARVFWTTFVELNANGLEGNQLLLNVNFDISYNGTRSFALVLGPTSFLYFDGENVSLYQDGALVSTIEDISSNVDLAIRADGALFVNANGEYVYMGTLDKDYLGTVGFVSLFGEGTFTISNLKLTSVCAKAQA